MSYATSMQTTLEYKQMAKDDLSRRPIKARSASWSHALAAKIATMGMTPNQVSVFSAIAASVSAGLMAISRMLPPGLQPLFLVVAALFIQLRLLCNLLDGLMAVEGGKKSKTGELYNELPDRVSDTVILVAAGYTSNAGILGIELGWLSALLALATAYVRAFGAQCTGKQDFCGPMAKQHRMFVMTIALLAAAAFSSFGGAQPSLLIALGLISLGSAITCIRRIARISKALKAAD